MGVYDQASRRATQAEPLAVVARLGELARLHWRFQDWTQTQTTPRVEGRDQTADRVAVLEDLDVPGRLWLALLEFQSRHEPDKLDDLFAEAAQFRRTLRHGQERTGKFAVMPILVYLSGECPKEESVLDLRSPSGHGLLHAPLIWEIGNDSASDALNAYEQGKTTWGILFWVSLMKEADEPALVGRWRTLVEKLPDEKSRAELKGVAFIFAGLVGRGQTWIQILEGWTMTESAIVNEWMEATRVETTREALLRVARNRFPGAVSPETVTLINSQPSLAMLNDWLDQAPVLTVEEFDAYLRR
jgi:hypothetical protein